MIKLPQIRDVWNRDANVRAFSYVLRRGESSLKPVAYTMRWPGLGKPVAYFSDFSKHPRIFEPTYGGLKSSAAGAYQITATTYDDFAPRLGITSFTPEDQDALYVAIVESEGALADVMRGDLDAAIPKLLNRWTSLPDAAENFGRYTMAEAWRIFQEYGGTPVGVLTQPAAPIEDKSTYIEVDSQETAMPLPAFLPPLLIGLAQQLFTLFTPIGQSKIADAVNKGLKSGDKTVGENVAKVVLETAQKALGIPDQATPEATAVAVVAAAQEAQKQAEAKVAVAEAKVAQAEAVAQAEQAAIAYLDAIAPLVDKLHEMSKAEWTAEVVSQDAAAQRAMVSPAEDWMAKTLVSGIIGMSAVLILFVLAVAVAQIVLLPSRAPTTEVWAAATGIIGTTLGILGTVFAFRFGTTRNSAGKDVLIGELSRKQLRQLGVREG